MKGHAMNTNLAKCSCSHCDGHLEFDAAYAGERVACPHCGLETLLYIPVVANPPPIPSSAPLPTGPAVQRAYRLAEETGPRPTAPPPTAAPPRITPPRHPNPFARQAAKASWISFIFAWVFSHMARGTEFRQVFLVTEMVFVLIGFALALIGLFGIRRYGTKGILMPAVIGLVLNGLVLGELVVPVTATALRKHHEQARRLQFAAGVSEYARQVKSGAPVTPLPSTGNANLDAGLRMKVDLINELNAVVGEMNAEIVQLKERSVSVVWTNKAAIQSELGKRSAGQTIVQKCEQDAAAIVKSARRRYLASSLPADIKQVALRDLDKGGQAHDYLAAAFSEKAAAR